MPDFHYGGQAVMEGVMMRGQRHMAVAVRAPNGEIVLHEEPLNAAIYTSPAGKLPFVRGLVMLWDMLVLGVRTLMFSANIALAEEDTELTTPMIIGTLLLSLGLVLGLFFLAPLFIVSLADRFIASSLVSNLVEGAIRILFVLAYIAAMGFLPDIRRVFAYHGAEHKTINAYEAGAPLEPATVQTYPTAHPRCGTSFLLWVLVIAVFVFALFGRPSMPVRIASRLILVPVLASVCYEILKLGANYFHLRPVRWIFAPALVVQSLTTRQPDESMIEVAIAALKQVLRADGVLAPEPVPVAIAATDTDTDKRIGYE